MTAEHPLSACYKEQRRQEEGGESGGGAGAGEGMGRRPRLSPPVPRPTPLARLSHPLNHHRVLLLYYFPAIPSLSLSKIPVRFYSRFCSLHFTD